MRATILRSARPNSSGVFSLLRSYSPAGYPTFHPRKLTASSSEGVEHQKLHLPRTYLIGPAPESNKSIIASAAELREKLRAERTNLVPKMLEAWDEVPLALQLMDGSNPLYGYIGMDDYTLHPVIRPGAFVRIDPRQKKIPSVNWHSDDRPIFFIELRERYVCTWCEMHDGRLILIPTQQSKRRSQQVRYPAEATIIGRVTGVSMDLVVEPSEHEARA